MIAVPLFAFLLSSGAAFAGKVDCARSAESLADVSATFRALYEDEVQDANDRHTDKRDRDRSRVKSVSKLIRQGRVCSPEDRFYTAWVMRHSTDVDVLQSAFDLAVESMKGHVPRSNWLTAAIFDRLQVYSRQPQRYGSMIGKDKGVVCLYEIDPDVTDADRAQYGMPPIIEQFRTVLLSSQITEPPTLREVKRRGLICPGIDL